MCSIQLITLENYDGKTPKMTLCWIPFTIELDLLFYLVERVPEIQGNVCETSPMVINT